MATVSTRTLWKGAISFGLVHIPVALHSATADSGVSFDWLDKRTMDPVGYKRINKKTGKEIEMENIVKGLEYDKGQYVVLTPDEIKAAFPKSTQTIEIEAFVDAAEIPAYYLEKPYYITPTNKGQKVYALLRETLKKTGKVGIARVVISTKEHLAALIPEGPGLVLNLLRWAEEVRPMEGLDLPEAGIKAAGLSDKELKMAEQLVNDMVDKWKPEQYKDTFHDKIMELVEEKVKAGELETVVQPTSHEGEEGTGKGAQILDLTELLQRSLKGGKGRNADAAAEKTAAKAEPAERKSASKSPSPARKAANDEDDAKHRRAAAAAKTSARATARVPARPAAKAPARRKAA